MFEDAGLIAEERNEAVKAPCTTVDDDSDLIRSRNGIIDARYRWRVFNVFIDPSYSISTTNKLYFVEKFILRR